MWWEVWDLSFLFFVWNTDRCGSLLPEPLPKTAAPKGVSGKDKLVSHHSGQRVGMCQLCAPGPRLSPHGPVERSLWLYYVLVIFFVPSLPNFGKINLARRRAGPRWTLCPSVHPQDMRRRQDAGQQKLALSLSCCPSKDHCGLAAPHVPGPFHVTQSLLVTAPRRLSSRRPRAGSSWHTRFGGIPGSWVPPGVLRDHRPGVHVLWVASRVAHPLQWVPCAPLLSPVWGGVSVLLSACRPLPGRTGCVAPCCPETCTLDHPPPPAAC